MPFVEESCPQCAGNGWKDCPNCHGSGVVRCDKNCTHGTIRCPAQCDAGYQASGSCDYCGGSGIDNRGKPCMACNAKGHMRCPTCNPFKLGGGLPDSPGYLRCPNECNAGYFPCLICTLYKWGAGKIGCTNCEATPGTVAVWHDDPPTVVAVTDPVPTPPDPGWTDPPVDQNNMGWNSATTDDSAAREAADAAARVEDERRRREQEEADRQAALAAAAAAAEEERQRQLALAAEEAERQRQADLAAEEERQRQAAVAAEEERQRQADLAAAAEAERQRQAEIAAAEEERRRNEGSA